MRVIERERTSAEVILYALYLYFLGLSFRSTSKAIQPFGEEGRRSHVAIWKWVQRFNPERLYHRKRVSAFLIDETMLQIDWPWIYLVMGSHEPIHTQTNPWSLFYISRACSGINKLLSLSIVKISTWKWYNPPCKSSGPRIFMVPPGWAIQAFRIGSCSPYIVIGPWVGCILNVSKPLCGWKKSRKRGLSVVVDDDFGN